MYRNLMFSSTLNICRHLAYSAPLYVEITNEYYVLSKPLIFGGIWPTLLLCMLRSQMSTMYSLNP